MSILGIDRPGPYVTTRPHHSFADEPVLTAAAYLTVPPDTSVIVQRIRPSDGDAVKRLWSRRFGGELSTQQNWIDAALDRSRSAVGLVARPTSEDEMVGCSFLDIGDPAYTRNYLGLEALDLTAPIAGRNGIFHLSCVKREWEGQGIGSAFYERRLEILRRREVPRAFGIAWHRSDAVDSRVLFEKFAFTCLASADRYYARTTPRPNCPECQGPCTCTASLYARRLEWT